MDENAVFLLEQQSPFFVDYLKQFPDLALQATSDAELALLIFAQLDGYTHLTIEELMAARDAAFRLCGIADGAGFVDVASFFYGCYEVLCGQIALYRG